MLFSASMATISSDVIKIGVLTAILFIGVIRVVVGTMRHDRWGINRAAINCPRCKQPMPQIRNPKSFSQFLWGGGTCGSCGCELDKWGRELKRNVSC
jgi:hypothetical protein